MLEQYSPSQIRLLREIKEQGYIRLTEDIRHDTDILKAEGLVRVGYRELDFERPLCVELLPKGEVYLSTKAVDNHRYHEPVRLSKISIAISAIALLISAFALLKSFGVF